MFSPKAFVVFAPQALAKWMEQNWHQAQDAE